MVVVETTCIAAKRLGMHYIGIDVDVNYCKIAKEKLSKVEETKINGAYASIFVNNIVSVRNKDLTKIIGGTNYITLGVNSQDSKQISTGQLLKEKKTKRFKENFKKNTLGG